MRGVKDGRYGGKERGRLEMEGGVETDRHRKRKNLTVAASQIHAEPSVRLIRNSRLSLPPGEDAMAKKPAIGRSHQFSAD